MLLNARKLLTEQADMKNLLVASLIAISSFSVYADTGDAGVSKIIEGVRSYDRDFNKTTEQNTKSVILVKDNKLFGIEKIPLVVFFGFIKPTVECQKLANILNLEAKQQGVDNTVNYYCMWL